MSTQLNITYVCPTHDTWVAAVPFSSEEQRQLQAPGLSEVHQVEAALVDPSMLVVHLEAQVEVRLVLPEKAGTLVGLEVAAEVAVHTVH